MKSLLNLIRAIVAISMPAAGFFLFMVTEGAFMVGTAPGSRISKMEYQAKKAPSEFAAAKIEGAKAMVPTFDSVRKWLTTTSFIGFIASTSVCILAMRAGRMLKRMIREGGEEELRT